MRHIKTYAFGTLTARVYYQDSSYNVRVSIMGTEAYKLASSHDTEEEALLAARNVVYGADSRNHPVEME